MQQICGVFDRCEDCACMLHIISLRAQISQNVKYWYGICDVLVPIFHSVKFAKCEICGSTKHSVSPQPQSGSYVLAVYCYVCFGVSVPSKLTVIVFSGDSGFFPQG